jgi:hypothetical protein
MLPNELLVPVFSFLGTTQKLGKCAQVCGAFRQAVAVTPASSSSGNVLWREIADRRYGAELAAGTSALYGGDYREMVKDDNRRGAVPAFYVNRPCFYRFNRDEYFFCCLVVCVALDRVNDRILLHLDVRGEWDLRDPLGSALFCRGRLVRATQWRDAAAVPPPRRPTRTTSDNVPGHFKGCLVYDLPDVADFAESDFALQFSYAYVQHDHVIGDYAVVDLGLAELRGAKNWNCFLPLDGSPFRADTPDLERERWELWAPQAVLNRTESWLGNGEW